MRNAFFICSVPRYEVNFQGGIDCGGAYIKLLSSTDDLDLVCPFTFAIDDLFEEWAYLK